MRVVKIAPLVALTTAMSLAAASLVAAEASRESEAAPQPGEEAASPRDPGEATSPPAADTAGPEGAAPTAEGTAGASDLSEEAREKEPAPVTGAFGIPLGERFQPCLVAKVLGEEPVTYRTPDRTEHRGTRYRVEPRVPNLHFNAYAVDTTEDGVIYAIRGDFGPQAPLSKCDVTRGIAASLEEKYGRPRGRDSFGNWYAFRDMSVDHYRGIRLYANRCRRGFYQIVYGDDGVKMSPPPPIPEPTATSGL